MYKFLSGLLVVAALTPFISYAALTDAQIQSVTSLVRAFGADDATVTQVSQTLGGSVLGVTAACPSLTMNLRRGMSDAATQGQVTQLQKFLAGYYNLSEQDVVTGYFGPVTQRTVVRFQAEHGLEQVGIVGALTRAKIASFCTGGTVGTTPIIKPGPICPAMAYIPAPCSGTLTPRYDTNGCQNGWICSATSTTPQLSATLDSSSPGYTLAAAGADDVVLSAYRFTATGDTVALRQVRLVLHSGANPQATPMDLERMTLWNGATKVGEGYFVGNSYVTVVTLTQPILIAQGGSVVLTVKADLSPIGTVQAVTVSGHLIQIGLDTSFGDTYGTSGSTGAMVIATGNPPLPAGVRVMKTLPTISLDSLPASGAEDGRLMRFKITANATGSLGIKDLFINIGSQDVSISSVRLNGYSDAGYSTPVSGFTADGLLGSGDMTGVPGKDFRFVLPSTLQIPAGTTRYFEVRGTLQTTGPNGFVRTTLLGDQFVSPVGTYASHQVNSFFVWTPNSLTTTALTDSDWTNGYGIPGLPLTGLTNTRTSSVTPPPTATTTLTLTGPQSGSVITVGNSIPISWSYANAPQNSQVVLMLKNIQPSNPPSGMVSGGSWQNIVATPGSGTGSRNWNTGPAGLDFTGLYELTAQLRQCNPLGCGYTNTAGTVYAQSNVIQFTLLPSTIQPPPPPTTAPVITAFNASPTTLTAGQSTTLSWSSTGTSNGGCYIFAGQTATTNGASITPSSLWIGNGSFSVSPNATTVYTLWCASSWKDGSASTQKSITVSVASTPLPPKPVACPLVLYTPVICSGTLIPKYDSNGCLTGVACDTQTVSDAVPTQGGGTSELLQ